MQSEEEELQASEDEVQDVGMENCSKFPSLRSIAAKRLENLVKYDHGFKQFWRGYLYKVKVEHVALVTRRYTSVKKIVTIFFLREGWSVDFFHFMVHLMNMLYYGRIYKRKYERIMCLLWDLQSRFGKYEGNYCLGNTG